MSHTTYDSGAIRINSGIPKWSLLPLECIARVVDVYTQGAEVYGDYNWCKGIPDTVTWDHLMQHLYKYYSGDRSEDHLAKAVWGLFSIMFNEMNHPELNNFHIDRWRE